MIAITDIASALQAVWSEPAASARIGHISIDSRSLENGPQTLFFALSGPNNDAHRYIGELIDCGVHHFIVSHIPEEVAGHANFLVVPNVLRALQKLAGWYRSQFVFPVIGVTGSNGKTIVKEWLNHLLGPEYNIIRSPKSYNSQVGVPLSVFAINERHNLGIFEAGISTVGEMEQLEPIIRPDIGILTNIGTAHDEGFENIAQKIKEKLLLFSRAGLVIYQKNKTLEAFFEPETTRICWSFKDKSADVVFTRSAKSPQKMAVRQGSVNFSLELPFSDEASFENAAHCTVLMLHLGYDPAEIAQRMKTLFAVEMRLTVKNGMHNTTLIDDSYSSDFQSLKIALDFLENQKQHKKKTLILSDIFQSGLSDEELYSRVSQLVIAHKITRVIGIGPTISRYSHKFLNCQCFESRADFMTQIDAFSFRDETILIKGARPFRFEKIVTFLEEKTHETLLEINLNAVVHNLNFYRARLADHTKIMVMVKAFGYGSGSTEIARLLQHHKVDYLGVAFADEGVSLRSDGISLPIMVLNPEENSYETIVQHQLEPEIYSLHGLRAFLRLAREQKLENYPVHIKLDTGMHRLGFANEDLPEVVSLLSQTQNLSVKSILSHLAAAEDDRHRDFTLAQIEKFQQWSGQLSKELGYMPLRHILNTSGISRFAEFQFDMVRLGIGLYGISADEEEQKQLELVGTLKSVISQLRTISAGESVGYGRRFVAAQQTVVATIPIGYADGIPRAWGNGLGYVMVGKKRAPILGSVCMDMLMADVTGITCREGDPVIIFGREPHVNEMARKLNTIPYEIITGISHRVKREFYRE